MNSRNFELGREFRHVDLFSGAGGFATGFRAAGARCVLAVEHVDSCVETYRANHPETPIIKSDVRKVTSEHLVEVGEVDVVTAGMPCETFSTAGKTSRSFYDRRQVLYREAIRIAGLCSAKLLLLENVPGLLTKRIGPDSKTLVIDQIKKDLRLAGYRHQTIVILNSADYGVPQNRERLFIVATKTQHRFEVPESNWERVTVNEAFLDLPKVPVNSSGTKAGKKYRSKVSWYGELMRDSKFWNTPQASSSVPTYHDSPNHRPTTVKRFSMIRPGEGLKDLFEKLTVEERVGLQSEKVLPKKWFIQRNRRLVASAQSPTVTSHCLDELVHPLEDRAITIREAARLQSFPDWYQFVGGPNIAPHKNFEQDKYEQIGDAVPPLLAFAIARQVMRCVALMEVEGGSTDVA